MRNARLQVQPIAGVIFFCDQDLSPAQDVEFR